MPKFGSLNNNNPLSTLSKAFSAPRKAVKVDFPCNFIFLMIVVKTKRCSEHTMPLCCRGRCGCVVDLQSRSLCDAVCALSIAVVLY